MKSQLEAGAAAVDITPKKSLFIYGYPHVERMSEGAHDPLFASAVLISNALKYGGRPPRVELGATAQEDGTVRFWVRDNGPGLAPEEQVRLFTRPDDDPATAYGLGLGLVQRVVAKIGGGLSDENARAMADPKLYPMVWEVGFTNWTDKGSLQFPKFKRRRTDKTLAECTTLQMPEHLR